ncbi:MAG TPA: putative urea ABC transporter substrate-binding protein [Aliidongia sp.]|nr:putative urea ABC transporter substrate-binding protein [Aliidongia sp.]
MRYPFPSLLLALALVLATPFSAQAAPRQSFKLAWSIYAGWMPWPYADESGILKKWADKYGIQIKLVQINDYAESINQYTAGGFDGVVLTNMDALTIPAAGGVDTTALIVGDYSNGNDAVILKKPATRIEDLKGKKVNLVQLSVSHYLLARALDSVKLKETDVAVVNTSDADIVAAFGTADVNAVVTWNPQVSEILQQPEAQKVFDSAQVPGEIIDLAVVRTETLAENPALGKALAGAWYEVMSVMSKSDARGAAARAIMAKDSGTDLAGYDKQLATTHMYYTPTEAASFAASPALVKTMDLVRHFSFDHGLLGDGAPNPDVVGIAFPDGEILGNPKNVKLRFTTQYMVEATN